MAHKPCADCGRYVGYWHRTYLEVPRRFWFAKTIEVCDECLKEREKPPLNTKKPR